MDKALIQVFLPENATIDFKDGLVSVVQEDLDDDGKEEALILYLFNDKYYLMGLKKEKEWQRIFNRMTKYQEIDAYECVRLADSGSKHIIIGGQLKEMDDRQLMVLEWRFDQIISVSDKYITYDQIELVREASGIQSIQTTLRENQQMVKHMYHYAHNKLVETIPKEEIEEAIEEEIVEAAIADEKRVEKSYLIEGRTAYLENGQQEEDVFLLRVREEAEKMAQPLYIVLTSKHKTEKYMKKISDIPMTDVTLAIGDFLNLEKEEVLVIQTDTQQMTYYYLFVLQDDQIINVFEGMESFWQTESIEGWYVDHFHIKLVIQGQLHAISLCTCSENYLQQWYEPNGTLRSTYQPVIGLEKIYPIYKEIENRYELHKVYGVWDVERQQQLGSIIEVYVGKEGQLVCEEISCRSTYQG